MCLRRQSFLVPFCATVSRLCVCPQGPKMLFCQNFFVASSVDGSDRVNTSLAGSSIVPAVSPRDQSAELRSARARNVVQSIRIVARSIQANSRGVEQRCGVSSAQLGALWEPLRAPGLRVSQLSQALSVHQSTTSNLLDKLEKKALVRRDRSGADQRVVPLYLTEAGAELLLPVTAAAPRRTQRGADPFVGRGPASAGGRAAGAGTGDECRGRGRRAAAFPRDLTVARPSAG